MDGYLSTEIVKRTTATDSSFDHNQSYPSVQKPIKEHDFESNHKVESSTDEYSSRKTEAANQYFSKKMLSLVNTSFCSSSSVRDSSNMSHSKENRKAVFTVTVNGWEILTTNKLALELLGYSSADIIGKDLRTLCTVEESSCSGNDSLCSLSTINTTADSNAGKIVDFRHKKGFLISTSTRHTVVEESSGAKCRIVMVEPIENMSCTFEFSDMGEIMYSDDNFAMYHGLRPTEVQSLLMQILMPSYKLPDHNGSSIPKDIRFQFTTSTFANGSSFPVAIFIMSQQFTKRRAGALRYTIYNAKMWVFPHMSGVITCKSNGQIQNVNESLSMYLFGYSSKELRALTLFDLVPDIVQSESIDGLYSSTVPHIEMDSSLNFSTSECDNLRSAVDSESTADSWVVVSLSASGEITERLVNISVSDDDDNHCSEETHKGFLSKINALLNNSIGSSLKDGANEVTHGQTASSKYKESGADSAIHSNASSSSSSKNSKRNNQDRVTSCSDYCSVDGSENTHHIAVTEYRVDGTLPDESSYIVLHETEENVSNHATQDAPVSLVNTTPAMNRLKRISEMKSTSTPLEQAPSSRILRQDCATKNLQNGFFRSKYKHKHGALIDFCYELSRVNVTNSQDQMLYFRVIAQTLPVSSCEFDCFNSTIMTTYSSLPSLDTSTKSSLCEIGSVDSSLEDKEGYHDRMVKYASAGEFSTRYTLSKQIGCGGFGFVQTAICKVTSKEFVVKFVKKERVLEECWVIDDETDSMIPLEIDLLTKFQHPNIVKCVDYFENKTFFSMVMPKHGANTMDLFEFIDRTSHGNRQTTWEPLCSYIFRQIVSAVSYLHARWILHRDIKDENVIIDENFHCKLIDFGSATYFKPGQVFSTFCGTLEYCSPEVLLGNKYQGPELEMWTLGVLLYTIVYGECPFKDVDETIACHKHIPLDYVTEGLRITLSRLLHPDPKQRSTVKELLQCEWINQRVDIETYDWKDIVIEGSLLAEDSLRSSLTATSDDGHFGTLEQENMYDEFNKLVIASAKQKLASREVFKPVTNLNNTI